MLLHFAVAFFLMSGLVSQFLPVYPQLNNNRPGEIEGTVQRSLTFFSKTTHENVSYSLYLPPDYYNIPDSFPVLYMLHGLGGDENSWINDFSIHRIADSLICNHAIPPMLIVLPNGRKSYFINDYRNEFPYETIFIKEFIPYIDSLYRTKRSKSYRVIGGLSMGGFGALINGFRNPGHFAAAVGLSAAIRTDSMIMNEKPDKYNQVFKPLFGDSIQQFSHITQHWADNNPLYLVLRQPDTLRTVGWYLDCGFYDYLLPGNEALHKLFIQYRIPHEYHVRTGNHDRAYWKSALVPALLYTGRIFRGD